MSSLCKLGLVVLIVGVVLSGGLGVMAAEKKAKPVTGEITAVDGSKITVDGKAYDVTGAKITVDGKDGVAADLKAGMKVKITLDGDKVTAVDAKASGGGGKKGNK
jgi:hypothetical protein